MTTHDIRTELLDFRKFFAMFDTFHDFNPKRGGSSAKELMECIKYIIPNEKMNEYNDIVRKYNFKEYNFGINYSFDEKTIVTKIVDTYLNKLFDIEKYEVFPANPTVFHNQSRDFFGIEKNLIFVPDANHLNEKNLCSIEYNTREYRGHFDKIDGKPSPKLENPKYSIYEKCFISEFLEYSIHKSDGSLLEYDSVTSIKNRQEVIYIHPRRNHTVNTTLDIKVIGVNKLITLLEETKNNETLDSVIIGNIFERFKLVYAPVPDLEESRKEYIRCLFDIKRSGDYMTVEAAKEANIYRDKHKSKKKDEYVFVSMDSFAVLRALLSGVPSILAYKGKDIGHITYFKLKTEGKPFFPIIIPRTRDILRLPSSLRTATIQSQSSQRTATIQPPTITVNSVLTDKDKKEQDDIIEQIRMKGSRIKSVLQKYSSDISQQENMFNTIKEDKRIAYLNGKIATYNKVKGGRDIINKSTGINDISSNINKKDMIESVINKYNYINAKDAKNTKNYLTITQSNKQNPYSLDRTFLVTDIIKMFDNTHPLHLLLSAFLKYNIKSISVFQYILYRFICHNDENNELDDKVILPMKNERAKTEHASYKRRATMKSV